MSDTDPGTTVDPPAHPEWANELPEKYQKNTTLTRFKSLPALLDSFLEGRTQVNQLMNQKHPGPNATPAQLKAYREAHGLPEEAGGYELPHAPAPADAASPDKAPDEKAKKTYESRQQLAFDLGLTTDQANQLANALNEIDTAALQATLDQRASTTEDVQRRLQSRYGEHLDGLRNGLAALYPLILPADADGRDRLQEFFARESFPGGVGRSFEMSEILFNVLGLTQPDRFVPGNDNTSQQQTDRDPGRARLDYGDTPGPVGVKYV